MSSVPAAASAPASASSTPDEARASRLRRSNTVKERIFVEWQKSCLTTCDDDVRAYWICRQEEGLAAPVKCGESNRALTRCLDACTGDADKFRAFKARRLDEMEVAATSGIAPFGKPKQ